MAVGAQVCASAAELAATASINVPNFNLMVLPFCEGARPVVSSGHERYGEAGSVFGLNLGDNDGLGWRLYQRSRTGEEGRGRHCVRQVECVAGIHRPGAASEVGGHADGAVWIKVHEGQAANTAHAANSGCFPGCGTNFFVTVSPFLW